MSRILLASVLGSGLGGEAETKMIRDVSEAEYREGDIVLGRGTNVIVSDSGACGRVLIMRCEGVRFTESGVVAESGAGMSAMALEACRRGFCGLEWAAGLPGSVGGAIAGNAGAFGGETGVLVRRVTVLTERGISDIYGKDLVFSYRGVRGLPRGVILEAEFALGRGEPRDLLSAARECIRRRRLAQPSGRSAGSTFLACDGVPAGYYIDRAGLKGMRIGGVHVSEKHANFIMIDDGAAADDFRRLTDFIKLRVYSLFGVRLKEEIRYIGRF